MAITASKLRENVYRILDEVLETGEPVEIDRKGRTLRIVADGPPGSRLARVKPWPDLIVGDPEDLVHIDWSGEWRP
jgi:antitoxin (DNA-binding transcriptional repressor) of toxin-antitoxin stability system